MLRPAAAAGAWLAWRSGWVALLLLSWQPFAIAECTDVRTLAQAQRTVLRQGVMLAQGEVRLPDLLPAAWRDESIVLRYRLDVSDCAANANAALWLSRVGGPYRLRVDGRVLLPTLPLASFDRPGPDEGVSAAETILNGRVPTLFSLPPGSRVAEVEVVTMPYLSAGIAGAELGPSPLLVPQHVAASAQLPGVNDTVAAVSLVVGLLTLALSRLRRQDPQLLWFALCSLAWGLRGLFYTHTPLPLPPLMFEQMGPLLTMLASLALVATTLAWMQALSRRRIGIGMVLLVAGVGSFVLAHLLGRGAVVARSLGFAPGMLLMPWLIWLLWCARERLGRWRAALLVGGYGLALASAVYDMGLVLGYRDPAGMSLLLPGFAALLTCMAVLLAEYVLRQLNRSERSNEELEQRIAEKTRSLELGFAERREHERAAARALEREHLLREMHDGLGGQLMTVLRGVERGVMSRDLILHALQESLDDLRLLMDSAGHERPLPESLAAWRSRWEPRLSSLGIALDWHVDEALDAVLLPPGVALNLMRIVQEATVNVVKHARASRLGLWAGEDGQGRVLVRVHDNGRGMPATAPRAGSRGLANMAGRARLIGAELKVDTARDEPGVCVELRLAPSALHPGEHGPPPPADSPGARGLS